jgi:hypothetical protein
MKNKSWAILILMSVLMIVSVVGAASDLSSILSTPTNNTNFIHERSVDLKYTPKGNNTINCTLTITGDVVGALSTVNDTTIANNTINTFTVIGLDDDTYRWYVDCNLGAVSNRSVTQNYFKIAFSEYSASELSEVTVDMLVGIGAIFFSFVTLIGLVLLFKWLKK